MARSARKLFEEAMRLDPKERATLLRLLIDTLDAESEEGSEDAWPPEVERRIAELDPGAAETVLWEELERGCTSARWRRPPSGSVLPQRRRWNPRMSGTPLEMSQPRMVS
jgi:putative addiction module component (TIGR02574 family)